MAADADIIRPSHVRLLDYEIESGLVLKRGFTGPQAITVAVWNPSAGFRATGCLSHLSFKRRIGSAIAGIPE